MDAPARAERLVPRAERLTNLGGKRLGLAVVVLIGLWLLAWASIVIGLVSPMADFDDGGNAGRTAGRLAIGAGLALFGASGPVAYWIGRRRELLLAPFALLTIWVVGIAVAAAT